MTSQHSSFAGGYLNRLVNFHALWSIRSGRATGRGSSTAGCTWRLKKESIMLSTLWNTGCDQITLVFTRLQRGYFFYKNLYHAFCLACLWCCKCKRLPKLSFLVIGLSYYCENLHQHRFALHQSRAQLWWPVSEHYAHFVWLRRYQAWQHQWGSGSLLDAFQCLKF